MIHPSYVEMIENINKDQDKEEAPLVTSRYSVVLACAKRARQIIDGDEPKLDMARRARTGKCMKPLSVAVDEIYEGKVNILQKNRSGEEQA